jgi:hypothetical protein
MIWWTWFYQEVAPTGLNCRSGPLAFWCPPPSSYGAGKSIRSHDYKWIAPAALAPACPLFIQCPIVRLSAGLTPATKMIHYSLCESSFSF